METRTEKSVHKWRHDPVEVLDQWCIYRIPSKLRSVNEAAYTPQLISIGPFHHGNPKLRDMESHKRLYYKNFCKSRSKRSKDELEKFMRLRKESILKCYAGAIDRSIDFVKVILVDACFIFELFLRNSESKKNHEKYYILRSPLLRKGVEQDLILFENQLPYYILEELYDFAMDTSSGNNNQQKTPSYDEYRIEIVKAEAADEPAADNPLLNLTIEFFKEYTKGKPVRNGEKVKHFTDLVRHFLWPIEKMKWVGNNIGESKPTKNIYDVRKLKDAGVKFSPNGDSGNEDSEKEGPENEGSERFVIQIVEDSKCKFNLACFRGMHLKLTKFWARYEVECIIRNVMALEQLMYTQEAYVCSYFMMLDQLVDTVEDVNLLIENGVINNSLGSSKAVAKLINSLCEQIMDTRSCYADICIQLNQHYKASVTNRNIAILKGVYFKDLWTGSSTILGIFVLVFSIIGTIKSLI